MFQLHFVKFLAVVNQGPVGLFKGVLVPRMNFCDGVGSTEEFGGGGLDTNGIAWPEFLVLKLSSANAFANQLGFYPPTCVYLLIDGRLSSSFNGSFQRDA
jgi:hypothetical protein